MHPFYIFFVFQIDHEGLIAALAAGEAGDTTVNLKFIVGGEVFECGMVPSQLMAPELQAKYPQIKNYVGPCSMDGMAIVVVNEDDEQSMSVTVYNSKGEVFYVDHKKQDGNPLLYTLTNINKLVPPEGTPQWADEVVHNRRLRSVPRDSAESSHTRDLISLQGSQFRIAIATTREYSTFYGNTRTLFCNCVLQTWEPAV